MSSSSDPLPASGKSSFLADDSSRAQFLYWFCGLCPLIGRILSPLVVLSMNRIVQFGQPMTNLALYNKLIAEVSRQFTKGVLGVGSYFGFAELVQSIMNRKGKADGKSDTDSVDANFWKTVTGQISTTAISLLAGSFFVPLETLLVKPEAKSQPYQREQRFLQNLHQKIDSYFLKLAQAGEKNKPIKPHQERESFQQKLHKKIDSYFLKLVQPEEQNKLLKPHQNEEGNFRQKLHKKIDSYFMKNGEPVIWKAATGSTMALATSLTAFSFVVYGLSRLLGHRPEQGKKKHHPVASLEPSYQTVPPFPMNPSFPPGPAIPFSAAPYPSSPPSSSPLSATQPIYNAYAQYPPAVRL
jgi:hypothetical protein